MKRKRRGSQYVEHPRWGAEPRRTGLDVDPDDPNVFLHWNTTRGMIPGTAVPADLERQAPATVPVTHYYDVERMCRDCDRKFLFFAIEQQYWYEELRFPLEVDCVRCPSCRKELRALKALLRRYEELAQSEELSSDEESELAETRLTLVENGTIGPRQVERVRGFLNRNPDHPGAGQLRLRLQRLGSAVE